MSPLPDRPDLDQLKRQARELLNAATAGEPTAVARLATFDARHTLAGAQLVIAREHGAPSWPVLKEQVEQAAAYRLRRVRGVQDLIAVYDLIGLQHPSHLTHRDWRFARVARRLESDHALM